MDVNDARETFLKVISDELFSRSDGDIWNHLNSRVTVFILSTMVVVATVAQIGGEPIYCWCPQHFAGIQYSQCISV